MIKIILIIWLSTILLGLISYVTIIFIELDKYVFDERIQTRKNWLKDILDTFLTSFVYFIPIFNVILTIVTLFIILDLVKSKNKFFM
jgi:hypothetical protein